MSYDISFQVRVHGTDLYVPAWRSANVTWNVRKIIVDFTGLEWKNEANNGLCTDVIPKIRQGSENIRAAIKEYDESNSPYSLDDLHTVDNFLSKILYDWRDFCSYHHDLVHHVTFWIT